MCTSQPNGRRRVRKGCTISTFHSATDALSELNSRLASVARLAESVVNQSLLWSLIKTCSFSAVPEHW